MGADDKINILLVDDQPAKLISYEVMLGELNENLIKAANAREALECLLKHEIAIVLIDVCMPDLDGFELAAMIREHPRFQKTAIIFISAIHLADDDRLRGYKMGAVDYMPVPVVAEILRAKVKVFAELYRKTRQLELLNQELEQRVAERTAELEASTARLMASEQRRSVALEAGQMGSWEWELESGQCIWDAGQFRVFGFDPDSFEPTFEKIRPHIHTEDLARIMMSVASKGGDSFQTEARIIRPDGEIRWCICAAAMTRDEKGDVIRASGVTIDITERKQAEEHHALLAREVDHRAKNALAVVQSIVRLTKASSIGAYVKAIEGRVAALSHVHALLSQSRWQGASLRSLIRDELAPYGVEKSDRVRLNGEDMRLSPASAQAVALVLHELATNSAKYGALSVDKGRLTISWKRLATEVALEWLEENGPAVSEPLHTGFGIKVIRASVESQLHGSVVLDWRKKGLCCKLSLPAPRAIEIESANVTKLERRDGAHSPALAYRRVLLVEDEALVALMMHDALTAMGVDVVGPFGRLSEALHAAKSNSFSAAILDVNIGGETAYEIAEFLEGRNIPFIFMTGYGRESIDKRFADVPVLRKPVDLEQLKAALSQVENSELTTRALQA